MNTITNNKITKLGAPFTVIEEHVQKKVDATTTQPFSKKSHNNIYTEEINTLHKLCGYHTLIDSTSHVKNENKLSLIDAFVGTGKTLEALKLAIVHMLCGELVVYGVHTIRTQVERSKELEELINEYVQVCECLELKEELQTLLNRIKRVSTIEKDSDTTVTSMFNNVVGQLYSTGGCVFVCNQAVRLLNNGSVEKNNSVIFFDDDNSSITKKVILKSYNSTDVNSLKSFFNLKNVEQSDKSTLFIVDSLKTNYKQQLASFNVVNQAFYEKVKSVIDVYILQKNNDLLLFVNKNRHGQYDVLLSTKLSLRVVESFKKVYAVSENVKNDNLAVFDWLSQGIEYDYSLLQYDSVNRGEKFLLDVNGKPMLKIALIAGRESYKIGKAINSATEGSVSKRIINYLEQSKSNFSKIHIACNKRSRELFNDLKVPFVETDIDTRGRNDLMDCDVSLLFGINTIMNNDKEFYKMVYKMTDEQIFENVTIAPVIQNVGRTAIRKTQKVPYTLILPDYKIAVLVLKRLSKYYPDVFTNNVNDELLGNADVIAEDAFKESNQKYADRGLSNSHYVKLTRLREKHGSENVEKMIQKFNGQVLTVIEYFKNEEKQEKLLLKAVNAIARKAKKLVKSDNVKKAAEKVGLNEFLVQAKDLKGKAIAEPVNDINTHGGVDALIKTPPIEAVERILKPVAKRDYYIEDSILDIMLGNKTDSTKIVKCESKSEMFIDDEIESILMGNSTVNVKIEEPVMASIEHFDVSVQNILMNC